MGDSTATTRGGASFERNETWNLGQMARATFGPDKVWVVGQYTARGTVTAAPDWGRPHSAVALRPALDDSYEGRLAALQRESRAAGRGQARGVGDEKEGESGGPLSLGADPFTFATAPFMAAAFAPATTQATQGAASVGAATADTATDAGAAASDAAAAAAPAAVAAATTAATAAAAAAVADAVAAGDPVAAGLSSLLSGPARQQRWVGVSYKPETELRSHYGALMLGACYDQVVFVDETRALRPLAPTAAAAAAAAPAAAAASAPAAAQGSGTAGAPPVLTRASNKRLLKEYQRLCRQPPPGLEAHPLEENVLEWHFVLRVGAEGRGEHGRGAQGAADSPYAGGEYHGTLEFPPEYPMRPPAFRVLTPSVSCRRWEAQAFVCESGAKCCRVRASSLSQPMLPEVNRCLLVVCCLFYRGGSTRARGSAYP